MKIASLWFLYSIVSLSKSARIFDINDLENKSLASSDIPAKRQVPIFPKRNMKFIVNPQTQINEDYYKERENKYIPLITRKPLMVKFIPYNKSHRAKTTEQVTRKSLMKVRTYTVKMGNSQDKNITNHQAYRKDQGENKERNKIHVEAKPLTKKVDNEARKKLESSQTKITEVIKESPKNINDENEELESSQTKITEVINESPENINELDIINKYLAEEEQDRNEFIFLEKQNANTSTILNDFIDVIEAEFETTTKSFKTTNLRRKRNSNIIEEDNATTASAFKYTGRDNSLTQDLYYKNIHH